MMFSTKLRAAPVSLGLALAVGLSGCSGSSPSPDTAAPTPAGSTTAASPASSGPATARDGSSLLPTTEVRVCSLLGIDEIRNALGDAARDVQPGEVSGTVSQTGVRHENCVYLLDAAGATTHAVILEVVTYPDEASFAEADPWEAMMSPTEVTGLWGEARYATNRLRQSTEHVLAVAKGTQIWRFMVSQPQESSTWEPSDGMAIMKELAETAKI